MGQTEVRRTRQRGGAPHHGRLIGAATALMTALAAGAIWCVLALIFQRPLIACALVAAGSIAWVLRSNGYAGSIGGAAIAAACTALTCAYAQYLLAAAQVAALLGLPMRSTLVKIGPQMAAMIARAGLGWLDIALFVVAIVGAALLVLRRPGHSS